MNNQTKQDYIKSKNQNKNFIFHKIRKKNNGDIKINNTIRFFVIIIAFNTVFYIYYFQKSKNYFKKIKRKFDIDFDYTTYENYIITNKIKEMAGWQLGKTQPNFINDLIRKYKPKNCLEIGLMEVLPY
jgi:hypothetical protein